MFKKTISSLILAGLLQNIAPCQAQNSQPFDQNIQTSIPAQIRVPTGSIPLLTTHAVGYQIYRCELNAGSYTWQTQAPDAKLLDAKSQVVGKHYQGPIWQYKEGSQVVGQIISKFDVDPSTSISWLLVKVIAHHGKGVFSDVNYINRIDTHGGLPPSSGCDSNHLGNEKRVAYTADYVFYQ
jgi:hypothetical protein